jgi:hypothetical protein
MKQRIDSLAEECIAISRLDWDSFETSWDFKDHPFITHRTARDTMPLLQPTHACTHKTTGCDEAAISQLPLHRRDDSLSPSPGPMWDAEGSGGHTIKIQTAFSSWHHHTDTQFSRLKANEEELNRIFIDIYGLADEMTPELGDKDITIHRSDLARDVRSFLSYAVGCMMGPLFSR